MCVSQTAIIKTDLSQNRRGIKNATKYDRKTNGSSHVTIAIASPPVKTAAVYENESVIYLVAINKFMQMKNLLFFHAAETGREDRVPYLQCTYRGLSVEEAIVCSASDGW